MVTLLIDGNVRRLYFSPVRTWAIAGVNQTGRVYWTLARWTRVIFPDTRGDIATFINRTWQCGGAAFFIGGKTFSPIHVYLHIRDDSSKYIYFMCAVMFGEEWRSSRIRFSKVSSTHSQRIAFVVCRRWTTSICEDIYILQAVAMIWKYSDFKIAKKMKLYWLLRRWNCINR